MWGSNIPNISFHSLSGTVRVAVPRVASRCRTRLPSTFWGEGRWRCCEEDAVQMKPSPARCSSQPMGARVSAISLRALGGVRLKRTGLQEPAILRTSCRRKFAPLGEGGGAIELEILAAVEVAFLVEVVVY